MARMTGGKRADIESGSHKNICKCGHYLVMDETRLMAAIAANPDTDIDPGEYTDYAGTDCQEGTDHEFAPGHDARLKGMLIRAGVAGQQVRTPDGMITDAAGAARGFGFHHQVVEGIARGKMKLNAKAAKASKSSSKSSKKTELAQIVESEEAAHQHQRRQAQERREDNAEFGFAARAKVGRWEYEGELEKDTKGDVWFVYSDRNGQRLQTRRYTLITKSALVK